MNLQHRIDLLARLDEYMISDTPAWNSAKQKAEHVNGWFIQEFINLAINNIAASFLKKEVLQNWAAAYHLPVENNNPKKIGIVMAGNVPLVGFHDMIAVFICGHRAVIKPSSKDEVLLTHLVKKLIEWDDDVKEYIGFAPMLKGCDAYISTGSNNSSRYFEYYFGRYPHIIRKNRTSAAILTGNETTEELEKLADDVYLYFGLGCRNVTKIYVPQRYDFTSLLNAFKKYNYLADYSKYKNNYDYNLALLILNNKYYMTSGSLLLTEDPSLFSPISRLNYEYYIHVNQVTSSLAGNENVQCIISKNHVDFGNAQCPGITDYADGTDTMRFLANL